MNAAELYMFLIAQYTLDLAEWYLWVLYSTNIITNRNQVLRRAQLYTTAEVEP